jgi:hypothetical protein
MHLAVDLRNAIKMGTRHLNSTQLTSLDLGSKINSGLPDDLGSRRLA